MAKETFNARIRYKNSFLKRMIGKPLSMKMEIIAGEDALNWLVQGCHAAIADPRGAHWLTKEGHEIQIYCNNEVEKLND